MTKRNFFLKSLLKHDCINNNKYYILYTIFRTNENNYE